MGYTRLLLYMVGLLVVVAAAWIFLTQTPLADEIPPGVALAVILLLVGVGIMAGARAMDDTYYARRRRVVHDSDIGGPAVRSTTYHEPAVPARTTTYVPPATGGTDEYVEERRY